MASFEYQRNQVRKAVARLYETARMYAQKRVKKFMKKKDDNDDGKMSIEELKGSKALDAEEIADLDGDGSGDITREELYAFFDEKSRKYLQKIVEGSEKDTPKLFQCPANRLNLTLNLSTLECKEKVRENLLNFYEDLNIEGVVDVLKPANNPNELKKKIRCLFGAINYEADLRTDETFRNYDDGSGFLSTDELAAAFGDDIDFAAVDANGSGFVTYSELRDAMQGKVLDEVESGTLARDIQKAADRLNVLDDVEGGDDVRGAMGAAFRDILTNEDVDIDAKLAEIVGILSEEAMAAVEEKNNAEEAEADADVEAPKIDTPFAAGPEGAVNAVKNAANDAANKAMGDAKDAMNNLPGAPAMKSGGTCGCC